MRNALAAALAAPLFAHAAGTQSFTVIGTAHGGIGAVHNGVLYGINTYGGDTGAGSLFSLKPGGSAQTLHNFTAASDGSTPATQLALDSSGNLYGTARGGGVHGGGTLWEYSAKGAFTIRHNFGAGTDGASPLQGPVIGPTATLYGTNSGGAINTNGNVFQLTSAGAYTSLHNFLSGTDGHCPFSGLARNSAGVLFGTTIGMGYGGNPNGSVWKLSGTTLTTLYIFKDGADGQYPTQAPTLDSAGNLYGTTTTRNGTAFAGSLWKITTLGKFSVLHSFTAATDGATPNAPLLLNTDGNLYGTTSTGDPGKFGTLFKITPQGVFTVLHSFTNLADGATPNGGLVHDASGTIYGEVSSGQVFKLVP